MNPTPIPQDNLRPKQERLGYSRYLFEPVDVSRSTQMVRDLYSLFELQAVTAADWNVRGGSPDLPMDAEEYAGQFAAWQREARERVARWLARGMTNRKAAAYITAAIAIELAVVSVELTPEQAQQAGLNHLIPLAEWYMSQGQRELAGETERLPAPQMPEGAPQSGFGGRFLVAAYRATRYVTTHEIDEHGEELAPLLDSVPSLASLTVCDHHRPMSNESVETLRARRQIELAFYAQMLRLLANRMAWDFTWAEPADLEYTRLMMAGLLKHDRRPLPTFDLQDDADAWQPGEHIFETLTFWFPRQAVADAIAELPAHLLPRPLAGEVQDDDITELIQRYPRATAEAFGFCVSAVYGRDLYVSNMTSGWVPYGQQHRVEVENVAGEPRVRLEMRYRGER